MTAGDRDPALRRFELDAVIACLVMAVVALVVTARLDAFLGVLGGGLLIGLSYRSLKGGVDLVVEAAGRAGDGPGLPVGRRALLSVKFFTRYALLAVAAYVMLTCLRLHPVGVLAGATSPFLAALMQVARMSRARARRRHP